MKSNSISIILFIILFTADFFTGYSEELETLPSTTAHKSSIIINLKNSAGKPATALLQINKINPDNKISVVHKWTALNNIKKFDLLPGNYQIFLNGGLRRINQLLNIQLSPAETETQQLTIKAYAPVEPAGWIMVDPLFINTTEASQAILQQNAQAQEIRATFANYITSENALFSARHSKALIAPIKKYVHPIYGLFFSFLADAENSSDTAYLKKPLYQELILQKDRNYITALSPVIFDQKINKQQYIPAEEFIFDTITGPLYDILLLSDLDHSLKVWYTLLSLNHRIPAIFSPLDKPTASLPIPQTKLYLKLPRKNFSLKMLHNSLKKGESIISNGPFIRLFVENIDTAAPEKAGQNNNEWINGHSSKIGGLVFVSKTPRNIFAEAYTCSDPTDIIDHVDLIYNGKVIESIQAKAGQKSMQGNLKVTLAEKGWLQLRYYSKNSGYFALTNPIYVIDHNYKKPDPAISKTQIQVLDNKTGKTISAKVIVSNFGNVIDSFSIAKHSIIIEAPATADITVEALGYQSLTKSIYLTGGSAEYIAMLHKKGLLERAQEDPVTYKYLQKALLNSKLIFKLKKK